jgi:hypothetical protein
MAKQIVARQQGDDYQARWFWLQACALFDESSKVEKVVYEDDTLKSFDDVAVYHHLGYTDEVGMPLHAKFYQVKFHVTSNGALTTELFCDPAFIGATTYSLLQRIKNAHEECSANGIKYRFIVYTPWAVHPDDPLAAIHSLADGSIRLDKLFEGGSRSKNGKIRKIWSEHLGLTRDEDLRSLLANVRIQRGYTLDELGRSLNWRLKANGLKPVPENSLIHLYDELTKKMLQKRMNTLTAESMLQICSREGLLIETPTKKPNTVSIGIRSFIRWAEDLQNQTQSMLCLSRYFTERYINNDGDWNSGVYEELKNFVEKNFRRGCSYRLHLDTHLSIAYLTGYFLPEKMGVTIDVIQHSGRGSSVWNYENEDDNHSDGWNIAYDELSSSNAKEIALAIGLTHDIRQDVIQYVRETLPTVGRVIFALPVGGVSSSSVQNGCHANVLANQLIQCLRKNAVGLTAENRVHIFLAAPNGFTFSLGRKMQAFPFWTLYEHDFGSGKSGAYSPSIKNPQ